jgi:tight adherence protein B
VTGLLLALAAAYGTFLLYTALVLGWRGLGPHHVRHSPGRGPRLVAGVLVGTGLDHIRPVEAAAVLAGLFGVGAAMAWALFGGLLPPLTGGLFMAALPMAAARTRRERRRVEAAESWPKLIEELRIKTTALGRSIPQALFEVGRHAPAELRPAFEAGRREWLISTDFERSLAVLKVQLADPTADTVCETLLVANDIGGAEIDRCLTALVDDRVMDQQGRKDALARQAGARFARRFVIVVPLGMALVGLTIGEGRAAYQGVAAQLMVLVALALLACCWVWAGRIMRLPLEERVLGMATASGSE